MKRGHIILAIGIAVVAIGSTTLSFIANDVQEQYGEVVILIPDKTLAPQTSYSAAFDLFTVQNQTLAVSSRTPNSFLHVSLVDENGLVLVDTAFTKNILIPLEQYKTGAYEITVTNFDDRTIPVNAIIAPGTILNQLEDFLSIAYNTLAASAMVFSGVVICIVGTIFMIKDRKKTK